MKEKFPINVVLDDIRSALNVGAIFRTCNATNIDTLYLTGITPYPPHNRIPKTALGAVDTVNWVHSRNKLETVGIAKHNRNKLIVIELISSAKSLFEYKFEFPATIVLGNEISGVSKEIIDIADDVVYVPMYGTKESLNVATTTGIVLYEMLRQYTQYNA